MDFFFGCILGVLGTYIYMNHKFEQRSHVKVSHPDTKHLDKMLEKDK